MCFSVLHCKTSNNFSTIKIIDNICLWNSVFNIFNLKNFFRPSWSVTLQECFYLLAFLPDHQLQIRIFIIIFYIKANIVTRLYIFTTRIYIIRLHFNCCMTYTLVLNISSNLSICAFVLYLSNTFVNLVNLSNESPLTCTHQNVLHMSHSLF